jgi:hypothetical protein
VSLIWRKKDRHHSQHHNHYVEDNVLLTVDKNNIVRLWMETSHAERFQFTVCSVIEPGAGTVIDWLTLTPYHGHHLHNHPHEETNNNSDSVPTIEEEHSGRPKTSRHSKVSPSMIVDSS